MKLLCLLYVLLLGATLVNGQEPEKAFYLKKSLKQDGLQYEFSVLAEDKRGVLNYDTERIYYWYRAQLIKGTQGGASGQLLHGAFEAFYANKQLAEKGCYRKGLKHGKWSYWKMDGTLEQIEHWKEGKIGYPIIRYDVEGKVQERITRGMFRIKTVQADTVMYQFRPLFTRKHQGDKHPKEKRVKVEHVKEKPHRTKETKETGKPASEETTGNKAPSLLKRLFHQKQQP